MAGSLRPGNALPGIVLYAAVYTIVAGDDWSVAGCVGGGILVLLAQGIVTIHNDIADRDIDRTNRRTDIPLAAGSISEGLLAQYAVFLSVGATVVAVCIGLLTALWLSVYLLLGWMYSGPLGLKNRPVCSLATLGICYGGMPWMLGFVAAQHAPSLVEWLLVAASTVFAAGVTSLKDFKDVAGDKQHGKRTFLLVFGEAGVRRLIVGASIAAGCAVTAALWPQTPGMWGLLVCFMFIAACVVRADLTHVRTRKRIGFWLRMTWAVYVIWALSMVVK